MTHTENFVKICDLANEICLFGECIDRMNYILGQFTDGSRVANFTFYESGEKVKRITLPKEIDVISSSVTVRGGK